MPEAVLFCEDSFHEEFIGALVGRLQREQQSSLRTRVLSSRGGLPRMQGELREFLRDLAKDRQSPPDAIIVVADANCASYNGRRNAFDKAVQAQTGYRGVVRYAIPDPHIERWMLADPQAFQTVFGRGCTLPAVKCGKDEYKRLLRREIRKSGIEAPLGGQEFAADIVEAMNLALAEAHEPSLRLFLRDMRALLNLWKSR